MSEEQNNEQQEEGQSPNEDKARAMGWTPKEDWEAQGKDPDQWRDADEFVNRQENSLTITRERLDTALEKTESLQVELKRAQERTEALQADFDKRIEAQAKMSDVALKRQRAQLEKSFEDQKRAAAALGDTDQYDALASQQTAELEKFDEEAEALRAEPETDNKSDDGKPKPTAEQQVAIDNFHKENQWFNQDLAMTSWADGRHKELLRDKPGMTLAQNLEQVAKEARQIFPDKIAEKDTRGNGVSPAEGGGRSTTNGSAKKGVKDLPAEARAAAERYVDEGIYESLAEYATDYFEQNPEG